MAIYETRREGMRVSYNLIKEYVDVEDISPEELAQRLTTNGLVLERMEQISLDLEHIVVGKIIDFRSHPEDSNLLVCQVEVKNQILTIVCGAKNLEVGDKVAVALEGAKLPQLGVIRKKKFGEILSCGMLCSASELGIEEGKSPGVLILDKDSPVGEDLRKIINPEDTLFDFEINSNRPDLLSIIGIAREVAIIVNQDLKIPRVELEESEERINEDISVRVEARDLCPRYTGRVVKGIKVKESPWWLKWKLKLLGIRPINNIVDITNLVMMETGQPLHAFDLDSIRGKTIIVRKSKKGESICTLDGVERQLPENSVVIADREGPIAIGGIMGGKYSEISTNTTGVFLESAYFDPVNNRKSSIQLGLRTEASNRFEKGVDKAGQIFALERAADLISKVAEGRVSSGFVDTNPQLFRPAKIDLRIKRVEKILGQLLEEDESKTRRRILNILKQLGFVIKEDERDYIGVLSPSFRGDVEREIDLIEEIARIFGYDQIKPTLFKNTIAQEVKDFPPRVIDQIREILVGSGLNEVITYSFASPEIFDRIRIPEGHKLRKALKIKNPLTIDYSLMRTSLIPGLLEVIKWNINRQAELVKIFEVGKIYLPLVDNPDSNSLPVEKIIIAGAVTKIGGGDLWTKSISLDVFDVKGIVETVLEDLKVKDWEVLPACHPALHPLRSGKVMIKGREIGIFGEVHPEVISNYRIPEKVSFFEIDLENLLPHIPIRVRYQAVPRYPSVQRDLSLIVSEEVPSFEVIQEIKAVNSHLIKKVILFDLFRGEQIEEGYKSMAYSITFQAEDHTLTDQEVENAFEQIREKLMRKFGAKIRE